VSKSAKVIVFSKSLYSIPHLEIVPLVKPVQSLNVSFKLLHKESDVKNKRRWSVRCSKRRHMCYELNLLNTTAYKRMYVSYIDDLA
jgi:hypothetical protein